jgi:hypothetical protein
VAAATATDVVAANPSEAPVSPTEKPPEQPADLPTAQVSIASEAATNLPVQSVSAAADDAVPPANTDVPVAAATPAASTAGVIETQAAANAAAQPSLPTGADGSPSYNALPVSKTATPVKAIVLVAAVVAIAAGAGAYVWYAKSRSQTEPVVTSTESVAASLPSSPPADVAPVPASAVAMPEVTTAPTTPAATEAPAPVTAKKKRRNDDDEFDEDDDFYDEPVNAKRQQGAQAQPGSEMMHGKATALLNRADSFIASGDYDNALATAQTALALDPGNTAALAKIRKIKQLRSRY